MRTTHRLTAPICKSLVQPGYHPDGAGLILQISSAGTKSWIYRYALVGRTREMGLGPFPTISLAAARAKADEARRLKANGIDPLGQKHHAKKLARSAQARRLTFAAAATRYITLHTPAWSPATANEWTRSIELHANPLLGSMDVSEVETGHIAQVLEPIWLTKNATAMKLRNRLESVLDWAKSGGLRNGDNPARWDGHLENLLPRVVEQPKHRPALPYGEVPKFMRELRAVDSIVARAMELIILCGSRTAEVSGFRWRELDVEMRCWRIPAARMKSRKEHHVPLSAPALALLLALDSERDPDELVFPSGSGKVIWDGTFSYQLRKMGYKRERVCTHGFRSSLRTYLAEQTSASADVAESVLAHDKRSKIRQAYERTRFYEQRVPLMAAWADFLDTADNDKPVDAK